VQRQPPRGRLNGWGRPLTSYAPAHPACSASASGSSTTTVTSAPPPPPPAAAAAESLPSTPTSGADAYTRPAAPSQAQPSGQPCCAARRVVSTSSSRPGSALASPLAPPVPPSPPQSPPPPAAAVPATARDARSACAAAEWAFRVSPKWLPASATSRPTSPPPAGRGAARMPRALNAAWSHVRGASGRGRSVFTIPAMPSAMRASRWSGPAPRPPGPAAAADAAGAPPPAAGAAGAGAGGPAASGCAAAAGGRRPAAPRVAAAAGCIGAMASWEGEECANAGRRMADACAGSRGGHPPPAARADRPHHSWEGANSSAQGAESPSLAPGMPKSCRPPVGSISVAGACSAAKDAVAAGTSVRAAAGAAAPKSRP
jgi:hypothetical protein